MYGKTFWGAMAKRLRKPQPMEQFFVVPLDGRMWLWMVLPDSNPHGIQVKCIKELEWKQNSTPGA